MIEVLKFTGTYPILNINSNNFFKISTRASELPNLKNSLDMKSNPGDLFIFSLSTHCFKKAVLKSIVENKSIFKYRQYSSS